MHNQDVFLEQTLLEEGRVTTEELETARRYAIEHQVDLVDALISTETVSGRELALVKAGICEAPFVLVFQGCEPKSLGRSLSHGYVLSD